MPIAGQNFSLTVGDTLTVQIPITDAATGDPINLTGATVVWQMKKALTGDPVVIKRTPDSIIVVDPLTGVIAFTLASADTASLGPGNYYHAARLTDLLGQVSTVETGIVTLHPRLIVN